MNNSKRLYRSRKDQMLGGVCAGLGDFVSLDPTIVRLIFVVLFLSGSLGFWIYLVMLIVIPLEPVDSVDAGQAVMEAEPEPEPTPEPEPFELSETDVE